MNLPLGGATHGHHNYDADKNGTGLDFTKFIDKFDTSFVAAGYGEFSGANGISGKQYATVDAVKTGVIFDAGKTDWSYNTTTHQVSGSLSALRFGSKQSWIRQATLSSRRPI